MRTTLLLLLSGALFAAPATHKIVLIAGAKSHGPGAHEYLKSAKLLKVLLDRAHLPGVVTEVHFDGWPEDPSTLDTAATIVALTDGQPSMRQLSMPLLTPERGEVLRRQMQRGCGLVLIHYSTFVTHQFMKDVLDWNGGYFEWTGPNGYTSKIKTLETPLVFPSPDHPIVRGIQPFTFKDEYYYQLRLNPSATPIVQVPVLSPNPSEQVVAWAIERPGGGRGFGTTTGHFFDNWQNDSYRRLILNAIVWTAGVPVPDGGVQSQYVQESEVDETLHSQIPPI